jgi:hypothetical protein
MRFGDFPLRPLTIGAVVFVLLMREVSNQYSLPWVLWVATGIALAVMLLDLFRWLSRNLDD